MLKIPLAALALATSVIAPAFAAAEEVRTTRVSAADLNLSSSAGRAAFDRRIHRAIAAVCAEPMPSLVEMQMKERRCEAAALVRVAEQIAAKPSPQLAQR